MLLRRINPLPVINVRIPAKRKLPPHKRNRRVTLKQQLQCLLAARRSRTLSKRHKPRSPRIPPANLRQSPLAALPLKRAKPIRPLYPAPPVIPRRNHRVMPRINPILRMRVHHPKRNIHPPPKLLRTPQPQQPKILLHPDRYTPTTTTTTATRTTLTYKPIIIIRHNIFQFNQILSRGYAAFLKKSLAKDFKKRETRATTQKQQ